MFHIKSNLRVPVIKRFTKSSHSLAGKHYILPLQVASKNGRLRFDIGHMLRAEVIVTMYFQTCRKVVQQLSQMSQSCPQVLLKLSQSCPTNPQWNGVCKDFKNQLGRDDEDRNSRDLGDREAAEERREQRRSGLSGAGHVDNHLAIIMFDNDIATITRTHGLPSGILSLSLSLSLSISSPGQGSIIIIITIIV